MTDKVTVCKRAGRERKAGVDEETGKAGRGRAGSLDLRPRG